VSGSDSASEVKIDSALETILSMIRAARFGRIKTLTGRKTDFLQAGM